MTFIKRENLRADIIYKDLNKKGKPWLNRLIKDGNIECKSIISHFESDTREVYLSNTNSTLNLDNAEIANELETAWFKHCEKEGKYVDIAEFKEKHYQLETDNYEIY